MIRKYHNHTLQTNPRHRQEESQNIYSNNTYVRKLGAPFIHAVNKMNPVQSIFSKFNYFIWCCNCHCYFLDVVHRQCTFTYQSPHLLTAFTGPRSTVSNMSGNRCESYCRSRGGKFDAFVEIDYEIISMVILLPSAESFKKDWCQLQAKVCTLRSTG